MIQVQSLCWEDPWKREWLHTWIFLPGEFHGQRSLVGYIPWSHEDSDTTEWLTRWVRELRFWTHGSVIDLEQGKSHTSYFCLLTAGRTKHNFCLNKYFSECSPSKLFCFKNSFPTELSLYKCTRYSASAFPKQLFSSLKQCSDTFYILPEYSKTWVCMITFKNKVR